MCMCADFLSLSVGYKQPQLPFLSSSAALFSSYCSAVVRNQVRSLLMKRRHRTGYTVKLQHLITKQILRLVDFFF